MIKAKLGALLLFFVVAGIHAQEGRPPTKVGDPAPPLHLEMLLQAPEASSTTLDSLKGNIVVVELWATWCSPCRMAQPHLNKLAIQYKDKPVRFISVTSEEEWRVKAYLSVNPIVGWIGIDRKNSFYKEFGFKTIPQTVLIDHKGCVAGILQPMQLTDAILDQMLAENGTSAPDPGITAGGLVPEISPSSQEQLMPSLLELVIRPAEPSASMSRNKGTLKIRGMALKNLVPLVFSMSPARVVAVGPIPEQAYELVARIPDERQVLLLPMVQQAMEAAFDLQVWRENRELDVLVLRVPSGHKPLLRTSRRTDNAWITDEGQISGSALTMSDLCLSLENELIKVILDDTGLDGTYDIALFWKPGDEKSIFREIGKQLGLELRQESRQVEVLCFEIPVRSK